MHRAGLGILVAGRVVAEGAALLTLMCVLARFRRLSVVWRVLSGPRGTSCFSCSR